MNFMFKWQEQYLTSERSERVGYCSCHEKIKFISCNIFYFINKLMTAFLMIFQRFPKIFQNCSEGQTNVPEHFTRISKKSRRLPKTIEEGPKMFRWYTNYFKYNSRDKVGISEIIDIFTCEYLHMWGYRIVFMNLVPLGIPLTFI